MPNPENLEKGKWKKGQSGNPAGRPKKLPELRELLANVLGDDFGVCAREGWAIWERVEDGE